MSAQAERLVAAGAQPLIDEMVRAGMQRPQPDLGYAQPDEWIASGQTFDLGTRTLEAIATPGHTRGHVVFADHAAGLLFAGDHVLPHITPSVGVEGVAAPSPLKSYLDSLRVVRTLPDLMLLPAHGPVAPSSHARVDELLAHHDTRLAAVRRIASARPCTAAEVAGQLTWTRRDRSFAELDDFNQLLAIGETVAHLRVLVSGELLSTTQQGLVTLYAAGPASR
jgi:glyoxylase-like metal-dependent hydrolase (beta-lactamase superfamily II)